MAKRGRPKTRRTYPRGYRPAESYRGKTPEARARQAAGFAKFRLGAGQGKSTKSVEWTLTKLSRISIIRFAEDVLNISFSKRPVQKTILKAFYGLKLSDIEEGLYKKLTKGHPSRKGEKYTAVLACGARGGKSLLASIIALYESICRYRHYKKYLQKGEVGYVCVICTREKQAQQIIGASCCRLLERSKIAYVIAESTVSELRLINDMRVVSFPCNSTSARGLPIFCLIFDEVAHFRIEGVKADEVIYSSLRPRQAQFPKAKCIFVSTPSAKQGLFYELFSAGFAVPDRLTVQASTKLMNPVIEDDFIQSEKRRDLDNYKREFLAQFAEQVDSFFSGCELELSQAFQLAGDLTYNGRYAYVAAVDQSGLSGKDRFGFAVSHQDDSGKTVVDCVRSWSTRDGDVILKNIGKICTHYHVQIIYRDRYAAGWCHQALEKIVNEVEVRELLPVVYTNLKSLILAGNLILPDNSELRTGLTRTQAYYSKANTLSIAHERSATIGHADLADAVATVVFAASQVKRMVKPAVLGNLYPREGSPGLKHYLDTVIRR